MSALIFVRDGRTLPYVPVTIAALNAMRATCEIPRPGGERRSYPHALAVYMALLELANEDRGDRVAISQPDLGRHSQTSRAAVQRALLDLQEAGVVMKREQAHSHSRIENEYVVIEPSAEVHQTTPPHLTDATPASDRGSYAGARPSPPSEAQAVAVQEKKTRSARSRAVTYEGHTVPDEIVDHAKELLDLFNVEAERRLSALKANGKPSDHLRQVIGALLANPDATFDDWHQGVRRVVADPPSWVDGRAFGLGDVFGPRAAARTLSPPTAIRNGHRLDPVDEQIRLLRGSAA